MALKCHCKYETEGKRNAVLQGLTTAVWPLHMIKGRTGIKVNRLAGKRRDYYLFIILREGPSAHGGLAPAEP